MTDLEKLKELFNSFGIPYLEFFEDEFRYVTIGEDFEYYANSDISKKEYLSLDDKGQLPVTGYSGFCSYYKFSRFGEFLQVGIYE